MAKLKIGVFGAHRGRTMIDVLLHHPHAEVVAVCDKFLPALEEVGKTAEKAGITVALYQTFEEFIKHDMDAVVLANYANEHAIYAVKCLKAGKHVMSEVLPCETMAQAVELIEAVEETGLVYAYAENYCYMSHTFEMWRRYKKGEIGEAMYGEGEYVHDCSGIWPEITYGEKDHWRNTMFPTFYCTHSLGPLLAMTGKHPVRVTGYVTQQNTTVPPLGNRSGECAGLEIVTLENGAIMKSLHGALKREPGSINYELYGMKGSMESERFRPSYGEKEEDQIQVYREGPRTCRGETERYAPQKFVDADLAAKYGTHNGSDFYSTHFFIERILGNPVAKEYSIDVYQAVDMGICGILAYRSVMNGNQPMEVPNLRNKEERDAWRNDNICTHAALAGDKVLPCYPTGNLEYPDEVYDHVRDLWLRGEQP